MIKLVLPKFWYQRGIISYLLLPFAFIYCAFSSLRKFYYKYFSSHYFPVPIIVVGNISVGGTGKTPLVIYLVNLLKNYGYKPGVVSRGYGGKKSGSIVITLASKVSEIGDEALLIVRRTKCPMVVDVDRVAAVKRLLATYDCDVIVSDDGLQHYALPRDIEIAIVDAEFKFGNGFCLPAGPLREPITRLRQVDFVIKNFNTRLPPPVFTNEYNMFLEPTVFRNVKNPQLTKFSDDFKGKIIHAVAGIGNPQKFFQTLKQLGLTIVEHPFPDHYFFRPGDFSFGDQTVIMTEKDAVRLGPEPNENFWYLELAVKLREEFNDRLLQKLNAYNKMLRSQI